MNAMGITAEASDTDGEVTVTPMSVFGRGGFGTVRIADADGRGLWLGCSLDWRVDVEEGDIDDVGRVGVSSERMTRNGKHPRMRSSPITVPVSGISTVTGIP